MGLLKSHKTLSWEELQALKDEIKSNGISYFVKTYHSKKNISSNMYWGDEIESMLCGRLKNYKLLLCSDEIADCSKLLTVEYARYMIESEPESPYSEDLKFYENLDDEFEKRRKMINGFLNEIFKDSFCLNFSTFPNFRNAFHDRKFLNLKELPEKISDLKLNYKITQSRTFPDEAIGNHGRFISFTKNIIKRRGKKIEGYAKIMPDCKTSEKFTLIDSMGHGMGCCCLQVTVQTKSLDEARRLYDVYAVLGPLMLRLTRASPIANGFLLNTETRWKFLEISVDCRNEHEKRFVFEDGEKFLVINKGGSPILINRNEKEIGKCDKKISNDESEKITIINRSLKDDKVVNQNKSINNEEKTILINRNAKKGNKNELLNDDKKAILINRNEKQTNIDDDKNLVGEREFPVDNPSAHQRVPKSRFSSVDCFISNDKRCLDIYNDTFIPENKLITDRLLGENVDKRMATHISSLFIRDPVMGYHERSNHDDFENIQSSNWRSVRLKLPIEDPNPELRGWKVEFRTMDVQITSFENACFASFIVILGQAVLKYKLNLYIPMSLVEKNFESADFYKIKDNKIKLGEDLVLFNYRLNILNDKKSEVRRGTIKQIFLGDRKYPGLLSFCYKFVDENLKGSLKIKKHLDFIKEKCEGKLCSVSEFIRKFVMEHCDYKNDSVVSEKILQDLIEAVRKIQENNSIEYLKL